MGAQTVAISWCTHLLLVTVSFWLLLNIIFKVISCENIWVFDLMFELVLFMWRQVIYRLWACNQTFEPTHDNNLLSISVQCRVLQAFRELWIQYSFDCFAVCNNIPEAVLPIKERGGRRELVKGNEGTFLLRPDLSYSDYRIAWKNDLGYFA